MNKLKLRLEDLQLDTFSTTPVRNGKGTVFGEQCTGYYTNCTCPGSPSCEESCYATCFAYLTCATTCDHPSCEESCGGTCDTCYATCFDTCGC